MRAIWRDSVRCPVSKKIAFPSGLHESVLEKAFATKLIGCVLLPSAGATFTLVKPFGPVDKNATQRLSGDQTNGGSAAKGGRSNTPRANTRSCFDARSSARISLSPRTNAKNFPSGENPAE